MSKKGSSSISDNPVDVYRGLEEQSHPDSFSSPALQANKEEIETSSEERKAVAKAKKAEAKAKRVKDENRLRKLLANKALHFVKVQLYICDAIVIAYVAITFYKQGSVSPYIIVGWMTATLVEAIGILWVIARSLFPFKDKKREADDRKPRYSSYR